MSFREVRNYAEYMRALGYPRLISMANFREPNFELVADNLLWMTRRYDPGINLPEDISTEIERIALLNATAQTMLLKARIKLNIKRLYQADGLAVKELLKVATLLYKSTKGKDDSRDDKVVDAQNIQIQLKEFDSKQIRAITQSITKSGANLHEYLGKEPSLSEARQRAIQRNLDSDVVEQSLREAIESVHNSVESVEGMLNNLDKEEATIAQRIDKRQQELDRAEKRLSTMSRVRPAYMDEYEQLQGQLHNLFTQYLDKIRNLEYLEHGLEMYNRKQAEVLAESEKKLQKMQRKLREEELRMLRGDQDLSLEASRGHSMAAIPEEDSMSLEESERAQSKPQQSSVVQKQTTARAKGGGKVVGSMLAEVDEGESEFEDLTESTQQSFDIEGGDDDGVYFTEEEGLVAGFDEDFGDGMVGDQGSDDDF